MANKFTVDAINKLVLAKLELKYCGNEGVHGNERKDTLRQLFKNAITEVEKAKDQEWKNTQITFYDIEDDPIEVETKGKISTKYLFSAISNSKFNEIRYEFKKVQ